MCCSNLISLALFSGYLHTIYVILKPISVIYGLLFFLSVLLSFKCVLKSTPYSTIKCFYPFNLKLKAKINKQVEKYLGE